MYRLHLIKLRETDFGWLKWYKLFVWLPACAWWRIMGGRMPDWFENFIYYEQGWLYHAKLGWMYSYSAEEESVWLWKENYGWLWTKAGVWPYLWSYNTDNWLYLLPSELGESLRFYDYSSQSYR